MGNHVYNSLCKAVKDIVTDPAGPAGTAFVLGLVIALFAFALNWFTFIRFVK